MVIDSRRSPSEPEMFQGPRSSDAFLKTPEVRRENIKFITLPLSFSGLRRNPFVLDVSLVLNICLRGASPSPLQPAAPYGTILHGMSVWRRRYALWYHLMYVLDFVHPL